MDIKVGSTSVTKNVMIYRSDTGAPYTGLVYNTAGLTAYYVLPQAAAVAITLVTQTVTGAFSSGGFVEIDATHAPGLYRLDIPNAALASGRFSNVILTGSTNMITVGLEINLIGWDNTVAILPSVTAGASGGLPLSVDSSGRVDVLKINGTSQTARDIGASVLLSPGTGAGQVTLSSGILTANANGDFTSTMKTSLTTAATAATPTVLLTPGTGTGQLDFTSGIVKSNVAQALGNAVTTTTNGILDVNAKNINNVSTSSVTTIGANVGTTQPLNFTGLAASALVKSDMIDIASAAVSTASAQIGVNVVTNGDKTGYALSQGFPSNFASLSISGSGAINNVGTVTTTTNVTNAPTNGDFTSTMKTSLTTAATAATPTVLLTPGTAAGQVTLSAGILTANANGDFTATMKTSLTTAATAATPTVLLTPGTAAGQVTLASGILTANANGDFTSTMKTSLTTAATAATPTVLLTPGIGTGQVTLASGILTANANGDFTATMKSSITTAATAATPTVLLTPGTSTGQVTLASGILTANANGDFTSTMKTSLTTAATAATPTVLLTPGTSTGQVTLSAGILTANANGDFTATQKTSLNNSTPASITGAVGSVTGNVGGSVNSVTNIVSSNLTQISGDTTALANFHVATDAMVTGTAVTGTLTVTQMSTNLGTLVANIFENRSVIFTGGTNKYLSAKITANDTAGTLTFNTLTSGVAPSNGDPFIIV